MRNSVTLTIAAGTVQRIVAKGLPTVLAKDLIITPLHGSSTGVVYALNFDPTTDPTKSAQTLVTELTPATATGPGGVLLVDRSQDGSVPLTINEWGVDGAHTGDTVQASWELSQ